MNNLGKAICARRIECGLSQRQMADKLQMSNSAVSRMENGQRKITTEMLQRIADVLNTTTTELISAANGSTIAAANEKEAKMLTVLRQLNDEGQATAIKQVNELRKIASFKNK